MSRKLEDWIQAYLQFTEGIKSPHRFRKWAAISTVAAALQRKVCVRIESQLQYPNLYILLIGPPGLGKGNAVKPAGRLARKLQTIKLAPRGITKRAFYTEMEEAMQVELDITKGIQSQFSALTAIIEEFGVFLEARDYAFMDALADVYDNPEVWIYKTQHSGKNEINNATFNLIACTTPRGLKERFTDDIFEQGLPARIILVYSDEQVRVPLFANKVSRPTLEGDLLHDLEQILMLKGEFKWHADAAEELERWANADFNPQPRDVRFAHYCTRRLAHITKLCMVISAAKDDSLVITLADLNEARDTLLEAETVMHGAISAIGANPLKEQMAAARRYIEATYKATGKRPVPEFKLLRFLYNECPVQYVSMVIDGIINSHWAIAQGEAPTRNFIPTTPDRAKDTPDVGRETRGDTEQNDGVDLKVVKGTSKTG